MNRRAATDRDPGLQPERTLLSWQRTVVLVLGVALLFLRDPFVGTVAATGAPVASADRLLPVLATTLPLLVVTVHVRRRWRRVHGRRGTGAVGAPLARFWAMALLSASVVVLAVAVVVTAL
ncbi:DUF202 domain-containing protein [Marinitenerispora sediminis]|uniref:DUF202 domain-containing protein n=1 Tax=Marinitenerispora sediminis TaxID=1931232 RepID=A0A368T146_9ACTN|nr:DUF202 domain-containing protein [Marinitenerispora sediminis]RCV50769.1 hypothetical protein DEF28_17035 [Marinitenerispora sediminis]RCV52677.1 hypothetical protein DEF23_18615 [Marinitenerispora sediminis]RCV53612.1 hypothetical protein DEF24_20345 [Marinitenerispora sediminis]